MFLEFEQRKERERNKKLSDCHHPGTTAKWAWDKKRKGVIKQWKTHRELNVTPKLSGWIFKTFINF